MIASKCVACGSKKFEHRLTKVDEIPLSFIQCINCGVVVGVLEHERSIDYLREIYHKLDLTISNIRELHADLKATKS